MTKQNNSSTTRPTPRPLSDIAKRALEEAEMRRKTQQEQGTKMPVELGGRDGPEPVRFGDWERKGIAVDF